MSWKLWLLVLVTTFASTTGVDQNVDLQWWDATIEEWKGFSCQSGIGPCISFDLTPGSYRIMSAYIKKGTKLTVHVNNIKNEHEYKVLIRSGEPPTETQYDYQMTRKEPGFTQWSCRGVPLFFRISLPSSITKKSKFGITLTEDNCIEKDYAAKCPGGWKEKGDGWCMPPKWYDGPCKKQNFFGEYNLGKDYSNPGSKVYKILWAERCGADWPCKEIIGQQCMPDLQYVHNNKWHMTSCKDSEVCQMFSLAPEGSKDDWRMLMVEVPASSSISVEVGSVITLKSVNRFREQVNAGRSDFGSEDMLGKDVYTLSIRKGEMPAGGTWEWTQSFSGNAPYVELHNTACDQPQTFFMGLYNKNNVGASKVGVTVNRISASQTRDANKRCKLSHIRGNPKPARLALL